MRGLAERGEPAPAEDLCPFVPSAATSAPDAWSAWSVACDSAWVGAASAESTWQRAGSRSGGQDVSPTLRLGAALKRFGHPHGLAWMIANLSLSSADPFAVGLMSSATAARSCKKGEGSGF